MKRNIFTYLHFVTFTCEFEIINPDIKSYEELVLDGTAKNAVISPDFLVWKFCGKAQFPHSFGRFVETVSFRKVSTPGNQVKLRYFSQCGDNISRQRIAAGIEH